MGLFNPLKTSPEYTQDNVYMGNVCYCKVKCFHFKKIELHVIVFHKVYKWSPENAL